MVQLTKREGKFSPKINVIKCYKTFMEKKEGRVINSLLQITVIFLRGARYLMGENLKVVWAKFSTISQVVLLYCAVSAWHDMQPLPRLKTRTRVCPVSKSLSIILSFSLSRCKWPEVNPRSQDYKSSVLPLFCRRNLYNFKSLSECNLKCLLGWYQGPIL